MAAVADILKGTVTEIKLKTGELVTVTCVQDDVVFALKGSRAESVPSGDPVAIPAQHEYLVVQCAGQTYRSPPGYVQRTVVPGSALDDAERSKDNICQVSLCSLSFDSPVGTENISDIREPNLKFDLCGEPGEFVLKPRFSGFCPIVTPKCLKIQDGAHKVTDYFWNMEMHPTAEQSRPFSCKFWDIQSTDVYCLVQKNGSKVVSEWNISTPQSMRLTIPSSKKPIQFGWSFDSSKNCITFSFARVPAQQAPAKTITTAPPTRRPARMVFHSPCIVSVSLNGKKKASFGFISRQYSPKVKFFEEDFGGEFDARYKTSAICFSFHEEPPDIRKQESIHYEYFAPECFVDIGSPMLLHLFRMLVLIRVFRRDIFTDEFKALMDEYIQDPMETSATTIISDCIRCTLAGSDCGLEDMEPAMLIVQLHESEYVFDWNRFEAQDKQFPLTLVSDYEVGSRVEYIENHLLVFASLDGENPVLPSRAIGETITSEKYVLAYLEFPGVD